MKISEFKDDEALDLLADILDPTVEILTDETLLKMYMADAAPLKIAKRILKMHKSAIREILARLHKKHPEEYTLNPVSVMVDIMDLLNDQDMIDFFDSQLQMKAQESSTSAMENTEESEQ